MRIIAMMALLEACGINNKINLFTTNADVSVLLPDLESGMNQRLGCIAIASDAQDLTRRFVTIVVSDELTRKASGDANALGYDSPYNDTIYVKTFSPETDLKIIKAVILHELGHAMGLDHTPGTIMDAKYKYNGPDSIEIAEDSLADLLDKNRLNPCKQ